MRRRLLPVLATLLMFVAACSDERQDIWSPEGQSARELTGVQWFIFIAAYVVGALVALAFVVAVVRYRARGRRRGERSDPIQVHGNFRLEIAWTILPAAILAVVAVISVPTIFAITGAEASDEQTFDVTVYGHQWWWSYEYDVDRDGETDIETANDLVIPAGIPIEVKLESRDVIHSFWVPSLAGTLDVVPGRTHDMVLEADEPGVFDGQCKEYCGLSHAYMRLRVVALSESEFATWLDQQQDEWTEPSDPQALAGRDTFLTYCVSCHVIRGLEDADGQPAAPDPDTIELINGHAPDLTHLMSRGVFASGMLELYDDEGNLNRPDLEQWIRDPDSLVPMSPDSEQGMPTLGLSEQEIDQLVIFLQTLGEPPPGAEQ
ncbi:MAG: cytochrome c oxidase subunit II [Acidimicrobiales bacterium]